MSPVSCQECGATNSEGNRFCGQCGSPLARVCGVCGSELAAGQRFCGQCGSQVSTEATQKGGIAPERVAAGEAVTAPAPELHWASILFVDLVEYTSLTQNWDAADVRELLSGYFDAARKVVERYGGVVEKFIGDAVVAVWGSQAAHEDDAERSVRAGLDVLDAVAAYGAGRGLPGLAARGGVVTGQVASWGESADGLVAGDRVNIAARVQSAAKPGSVLVDDVTMRATRETVAYAPAGEHRLKGIDGPMTLWTAVRIIAGVGGSQRVDGLEAAFVGRTRELTLVKELFHATVETGRARLVAVTGQAGIGKTRLSWEFEKYLDGLALKVFWHRGRCLSYGDGVAFWALAEMVRQRLGIAEDDAAEVAQSKLCAALPKWLPDAEERAFVEPRLGVLVGAVDRGFSREELFGAWRLFFERLADTQPVVLLVEDLHWADNGLLDFLEHLLDWSSARPLYLLTFARPELGDRGAGLFADRRNVTPVHLDPLPVPVLEELLEDLVPGMPGPVKTKIAAQSAGVPLYAVETVRALIDRDLVVPRDGVYRLVGEVDELEVPASLTSLIAARLDELPSAERELVKGLSVLGSSFARHAVTAVTDVPVEQVDALLQTLVRKDVLTVRADPLSPERGQYEFVQSMLQSVAHDMLSRRDRKLRHLSVAQHLRSAFPDDGAEVVEVLAAHYHDAYLASQQDPDADQVRAEAAKAFERAGDRAGSLGSPDSAEKHYRAAAGLALVEADQARLTAAAARMSVRSGRLDEGLQLYEKAARTHRDAGRAIEAARLAAYMGGVLQSTGRSDEAIRRMQEGLVFLDEGDAAEASAELHAALAETLQMTGDLDGAANHIETALTLATAHQLPEVLASALGTRALMLVGKHRVVEAAALFSATIQLAQQHGLSLVEATNRGNLADVLTQSDLPAAESEHAASLALSARLGAVYGQALTLGNLALLHFYGGRWTEVEKAAKAAIEVSPVEQVRALGRFPLVLLHSARGDTAQAKAQLSHLSIWTDSDDVQDRDSLQIAVGAVALGERRLGEAVEAASRAARDSARDLGFRSESFRLAWPMALEAALIAGDVDEAQSLLAIVADAPPGHVPPYLRAQLSRYRALAAIARAVSTSQIEADLRSAADALRELGYLYWLARAQADLGRWLAGEGRSAEAEPMLSEAHEVLTELGALPDLERLRQLERVAGG